MLFTTFNKLHKNHACTEGYQKLARSLGGVNEYGKDTPISLDKILESNGLHDTIWSLRATTESSENLIIEFACQCAEHVLHFYIDKYPDDKRPRLAIVTARVCITDKSPEARDAAEAAAGAAVEAAGDARDAAEDAAGAAVEAAWAAVEAAWAAGDAARAVAWAGAARDAWAAAGNAAGDAARAARAARTAGDAEEKWQTEQLLELLNK